MARMFEIRSGRRAIGLTQAATAHEALRDYVRSLGCRSDEIMALGTDAVSWRGAIYKAVPTSGAESAGSVDSSARSAWQ